jgi:D-lactate dehydrogenase
MKIAFFSTKPYDQVSFQAANENHRHELVFFEPRLNPTTVALAEGFPVVCVFINDELTEETLQAIARTGTKAIALRCAGFNNVDLQVAAELGLSRGAGARVLALCRCRTCRRADSLAQPQTVSGL